MGEEDLPDFGLSRTDINSDLHLIPTNYFVKSFNPININLKIQSEQEIKITCKNSLVIYYKIDQTWKKRNLPCHMLDKYIIDSIDIRAIDPNQKDINLDKLKIENPVMYPNLPGSVDNRNDLILGVKPVKSDSQNNTISEIFEIIVKPYDLDQEKNIWIILDNEIVYLRHGDLIFFIQAESRDLKTGLSKPIGAFTKIWIMD